MSTRLAKVSNFSSTLPALLGFLLFIITLNPMLVLAQEPSCIATTLPPGSVFLRPPQTFAAERELVRVPVSAPGVLELYVSAGTQTAPRMVFLGRSCSSPPTGDASWTPIRETPRELHLMIHVPGDFFVEISSADPGVPLPAYTLHATAAIKPLLPDEVIALAENPSADCRADDLPTFSPQTSTGNRFVVVQRDAFTKEVDPWDDDGMSGHLVEPGVLVVSAPDATIDAALHDGEGCALEQRVAEGSLDAPDAFVAAPVHAGAKRLLVSPRSGSHYDVYIRHFALCAEAADDHPDRPLCATTFGPGHEIKGRVAANDEDHFTFALSAQQTVDIDLAGNDRVRAMLFDTRGQRLAAWSAGHLVRTLGAGRFYVLVTNDGQGGSDWRAGEWMSEGAEVEYSIRLETIR